jgi:NaMN:DMB phosphoribosyltransferase
MGIGNTSRVAAVAAPCSAAAARWGRGTGVDDQGLARVAAVIDKALASVMPPRSAIRWRPPGAGWTRACGHSRCGARGAPA